MDRRRFRYAALGLLFGLTFAATASGQTGDRLCDATQSTADTCVITGAFPFPDMTVLTFTKPSVDLRGSLTITTSGVCSLAPATACASDADCVAPARCARPKHVMFNVAGTFTIEAHAAVVARGEAAATDTIGPDGGTITIAAHDVTVAGTLDVSAVGVTGIPAGRGGQIVVHAAGSVTLAATARLDGSTARGGCGGSITIDGADTIAASGLVTVDGAALGGKIELDARGLVTAAATFQASNTDGDLADVAKRPCADGHGGGRITINGGRITFTGAAKANGREAAGGVVRLEGERDVTVDSNVGTTPISVFGGDQNAVTTGGGVFLVATAGDIAVRNGAIVADGLGSFFGSDAGTFSLSATGATRCETSDSPCAGDGDCQPGERCVQKGGNVLVAAPLSAAGGAGLGSGCIACEIRGTESVAVTSPVDVGGGRRALGAGKLTISAGTDLTLGPGGVFAAGGVGGAIVLVAGASAGSRRDVSGVLRVVNGTEIWAVAFDPNIGFGGHVGMEGCDVHVEAGAGVRVDGTVSAQGIEGIDVIAHDRLAIDALAVLSALPDGDITLSYGVDGVLSPDASVHPPAVPQLDPSLPPCPACGNGVIEPPEECDGEGTCAAATAVCLPPGTPAECTCRNTCGNHVVDPGEQCDGDDLNHQTCVSLGFAGGPPLTCNPDCTFDTSKCVPDVCGDGIVGASEQCDPGGMGGAPPSFGGMTCATLGHPGGGVLACAPGCAAIVTRPHCAGNVVQTCTTDVECAGAGPCVGGCVECGNGFVDPGEECDDGAANGSAPNHCRFDCRAPSCGDGIVDPSHCAGSVDAVCATTADCGASGACVPGESCDRGAAVCLGGVNDGRVCCRATDCPGGECSGGDCTRNRDDVPGCCRCDCTLVSVGCPDCDDGNPCTSDGCDPTTGCTHVPVADGTVCGDQNVCDGAETCRAGTCRREAALDCDDTDPCTLDTCVPMSGCRHAPLRYADAGSAIEASLFVPACTTDAVPPAIIRQLKRAQELLGSAGTAKPARAARLLHRAVERLSQALHTARRAAKHRLSAACSQALTVIVEDARRRAQCLLPTP